MSGDTIDPDGISPWWPCPDCGGIHFQPAFCTWERGSWHGSDGAWLAFEPPAGRPTGIATQVTCLDCGHEFDIARHYGWPTLGDFTEREDLP